MENTQCPRFLQVLHKRIYWKVDKGNLERRDRTPCLETLVNELLRGVKKTMTGKRLEGKVAIITGMLQPNDASAVE